MALAVIFLGRSANASELAADCSLYEIQASAEGEIDKELAKLKGLRSTFKKPPLSAWKGFKLLKKHSKKAIQQRVVNVPLSAGGTLGLLLRERQEKAGKKPRLRFNFTVDDKGGRRQLDGTITFASGQYTLLPRNSTASGGDVYLLALTCKDGG
jgi:hypothetical protein